MPRSSPTVRRRLFTLVVAVAFPLLALVVGAVWYIYDGQRARAEDVLLTRAQSVALAVQEQVERRRSLLATLVASPALASGDLASFRLQMDAAAAAVNRSGVALIRPDGTLIETTMVPHGTALPSVQSGADLSGDIQSGRSIVTGIYTSPFTGLAQIAVAMAVPRSDIGGTPWAGGGAGGEAGGAVLVIALPLDVLSRMLRSQGLPDGWQVSVVDREGRVVAGSENDATADLRRIMPSLLAGNPASAIHRVRIGGEDSIVATAATPDSTLTVVVRMPATVFTGPLQETMVRVLIVGGTMAALSLLLALGTVRSIATAIRRVPLMAAIGAPPGATGLLETDALARALAEARIGLEKADERAATLAALAAQSSDFIAVMGPDDRITYLNEAARRMVGLARHDGWRLQDVLSPEDRDFFDTVITPARLRDGAWRGAFRFRHIETGAAIAVDCNIFTLQDPEGDATSYATVTRDISAQKVAEEELRDREAELARVQRIGSVGGFEIDLREGGFRNRRSPEYLRLHGLTEQSTTEAHDDWVRRLHPEDRDRTERLFKDKVLGSDTDYAAEYRIVTPTGEVRWISAMAEIERDAEGNALRMVGAHIDITTEREARDQLHRLNEDLEARVRDEVHAREVTQAHLAQAQRLEALGQLAGGIAHDFNNVLQAVQGGGALILRSAGDAETVRRLTRMLLDAASRGASITRRLLAFSRRGELRAEVVDVVALLSDMHEILVHTLGSSITVRLDVRPDTPKLLADKGQFETVLVNLATNARDAMPEGGELIISAGTEMVAATADAARQADLGIGSYVRIAVSDTGIGMNEATLARAAEPFFTTKPTGIGTGLGLAMARGFATQSGGALNIDSRLGQGTTITMWLPVAGELQSVPPHVIESDQPEHGRLRARILLTDDDHLVRETLGEQLTAVGYSVVTASDGQQALAVLGGGEKIDLLVSDLSMQGMSGLALIQQAQRKLPELPAILLTGFATDAAAAMVGSVAGSVSLLRKPVSASELVERITVMLEGVATNRRPSS